MHALLWHRAQPAAARCLRAARHSEPAWRFAGEIPSDTPAVGEGGGFHNMKRHMEFSLSIREE